MKVTAQQIRDLREKTGAPVMRVKKVLEELNGDEKKASEILTQEGFEKAEKRAERETKAGLIETYVHHSGRVASIVELYSETDFVARNELFRTLAHNIALQVASMGSEDLLKQSFIKEPNKTIGDLVKEVIAKTGENVKLGRYYRFELGRED
jgi:elongation factor Ts